MTGSPTLQFRALADPTRRGIMEYLLSSGGQTVHALTQQAGVSQPAVSKHLRILKEAGLVRDHPQGRETRYEAVPEGLGPLVDWIQRYARYWQECLDSLETVLEEMDRHD